MTLSLPFTLTFRHIAVFWFASTALAASACTPPPNELFEQTEKRVRERYAAAESVELVDIIAVQRINKRDIDGNTVIQGERVTFRVNKIYKGKSKSGEKIIVVSTPMCDYSVDGNAALKTYQSVEGVIIPPRQWLLYRQAGGYVRIGESDMARPINEVGFDLQLLERWRKKSAK